MKEFNNILLVSGSGRNIGKTTLACNIITQISNDKPVYGIKITPHFHAIDSNQEIVEKGEGFKIFQEKDIMSDKDSSRMIRAGAHKVYFVQCDDVYLPSIYKQLVNLLPPDCAVVCESGSFAGVFKPGLHFVVKGKDVDESKQSYISNLKRADLVIDSEVVLNGNLNYNIEFIEGHWLIK